MSVITMGLAFGLSVTFVYSQWSGALGSSWNNPASASISRMLVDRINQRMLARRLDKKGGGTSKSTAAPGAGNKAADPTKEGPDRTVRFTSTGKRVMVDSIASQLGGTSGEQQQMRQLLSQILDAWDREVTTKGHKNDLALAFASFLIMSSAAYHGTPLPDDAKVIELRDVIAEISGDTGLFEKTTDRQKQEMYELLVIFGTLAYTGYDEANRGGDRVSAEVYRQLGGQNLQTVFGLKPDDVRFGPDGLSLGESKPLAGPEPQPAGAGNSNVLTISAGDLVKAFEDNEVRASSLYAGKRLRISGSLNSIEILPNGGASLTFRSSIISYGMVMCYFDKGQKASLARFSSGDPLTVEGKVKELGGGWDGAKAFVVVEGCVVK